MSRRKGFTLVELVMIIVLLGILAAVAIPRYFNLSTDATQAAEKGVLGGVRAGISTYFAQNKAFPSNLDSIATYPVSCVAATPCFDTVLAQGGVTEGGWIKTAANTYTGPTGTIYTYTPTGTDAGSFK
ncbi:MAG: type II secretion system protein [Candidatus Omnitrophota bacterium]